MTSTRRLGNVLTVQLEDGLEDVDDLGERQVGDQQLALSSPTMSTSLPPPVH